MRRLLVTGGAGFIGSNFVQYWIKKNPDHFIVVLDALTYAGNKNNLAGLLNNSQLKFVKGNICDQALVQTLLSENSVDTLVHFAAESHVDRSITGPDAFIQTNIIGTHSLLQAAKVHWLDQGAVLSPQGPPQGPPHGCDQKPHRFHHVSTDEVYGTLGPQDPAFTEHTAYAPNSPYAASKAASDHLVRAYHHTYGLQVSTSNCSNNYGPCHFPEKLIPLCLLNILMAKPLPIYGDGQQIRDWLYVDDHSRGIELILNKGAVGETYNIGGNNEWTNIDTVKLLCKIVDNKFSDNQALHQRFPLCPAVKGIASESLISFVTDRAGHDTRYAINAKKIMAELAYQPEENFDTGLNKTVQWYFDNENWWRAVEDGSYRN